MHIVNILNADDLPEECIEDCSRPGQDASDAVEHWRQKLNFTVDRSNAIRCLRNYGAWEDEELQNATDDELADKILWLACCDFNEHDNESDIFALENENIDDEVLEEGLKLLGKHTNGDKEARVYKDSDYGEHRVKLFHKGVHQKDADYHTNDKEDAHGTAKHMIGLKEGEDMGTVTEETVVADRLDPLRSFVDQIVNNDHDTARDTFGLFLTSKAAKVLGTKFVKEEVSQKEETEEGSDEDEDNSKYLKNRDKKKEPIRKMKKTNESVLKEFTGNSSPIRLKGDEVFVNGKEVGSIQNDLNDPNSGIIFTSTDGKMNEEFDTMKDLYGFLVRKFGVKGEVPLDNDED